MLLSHIILLLGLVFSSVSGLPDNKAADNNVHTLYPGDSHSCCNSIRARQLQIYCYSGRPKHIIHIFQTVLLKLNISTDQFDLYEGPTPDIVRAEYDQHRSSWSINIWGSWKSREIKLSPFNRSCIGVSSDHEYTVHLQVIRVDYWRVLLLASALALFISAPRLSANPLFYYICGVSFGMAASFLILIYFVSRIFPKRPMMYGFLAGGWTVVVYLIQLAWDNIRVILSVYQTYVATYIAVTGLVSFVVCYRLGPVTNERSKNLIKWTLQGIPLLMILYCSHFQEAMVAFVLLLLAVYNFPRAKRRFPPKVSLMSEDEYYEQGVKETKKALDELRGYCSSPDCNQWKTVLRLKDPVRFAKFMEGRSHLEDDEILEYEGSAQREEPTDDSEDSAELTD